MQERRDEPVGELAKRLLHDMNTLARDHIELGRVELTRGVKRAAKEAAGLIAAVVVGLVGFAMLCATLVVALEPVLEPLWARMLLCSGLYLALGGIVVGVFMSKLKRDVVPELPRTKAEVKHTRHVLTEEVQHG